MSVSLVEELLDIYFGDGAEKKAKESTSGLKKILFLLKPIFGKENVRQKTLYVGFSDSLFLFFLFISVDIALKSIGDKRHNIFDGFLLFASAAIVFS